MSRFRNAWAASCVALVGALLTLGPPAFAQGEKTIRAVMHAEVKWVDPALDDAPTSRSSTAT